MKNKRVSSHSLGSWCKKKWSTLMNMYSEKPSMLIGAGTLKDWYATLGYNESKIMHKRKVIIEEKW